MLMRFPCIAAILIAVAVHPTFSESEEDVVYLLNGSIIRGTIVSSASEKYVIIQSRGMQVTMEKSEILMIVSEPKLTPEQETVTDIEQWWTETPEGKDFWSLIQSGEKNEQWGRDVLADMAQGYSYTEAKERRHFIAMGKRVSEDIRQIGIKLTKASRDPTRPVGEMWKGTDIVRAFPVGLFEALFNLVRGEADLTDICGVLFLPCVVICILTKRVWLKLVTGFVWFLDLLADPEYWPHHFVATALLATIVIFIRWGYRKNRTTRSAS